MAWCRLGTKPLSKPMMTQFNDVYLHPQAVLTYEWHGPSMLYAMYAVMALMNNSWGYSQQIWPFVPGIIFKSFPLNLTPKIESELTLLIKIQKSPMSLDMSHLWIMKPASNKQEF